MPVVSRLRQGFTLVEVLVAVFITVVALGALVSEAMVTLRRLQDSARESLAARLVRGRAERIRAAPCAASGGIDSSGGVDATWSATTDGQTVRLTQIVHYPTAFGDHIETYQTLGACR